MPFVAPRGNNTTAGSSNAAGAAGRTTFRPPWVKDDAAASPLKSTVKTSVPWAKRAAAEKENGEKAAAAAAAPTSSTTANNAKKTAPATTTTTAAKKVVEPIKKSNVEAVKKPTVETTAKKIVTPVKKATESSAAKVTPAKKTTIAAAKKKEPTPPPSSSSEEEEEEEDDEEDEEDETEEETTEEEESDEESEESEEASETFKPSAQLKKVTPAKKQQEEESELKRRFSIEKPKLRPVVVKRDKSMKKIEDDDEHVEGETEEERERRLRFKLEKPKLRHVKREEKPLPSKSTENILKIRAPLKKVPKVDEILKEPKEEPKPEFKTKTLRKAPSIKREQSIKNVPAPPPLPSLIPKAPPPPPPPFGAAKKDLTDTQKATLEKLKTRPRRRPDWSEMMKEVESGRKLRHVQCNDRSQPILTCKSMTKVDDKFIYETEKDNSHNKLLKQIQGGVRLKPTQTNDRSKPILGGLRKFRRQMTIEEQLQKSQSKINMLGEAPGGSVVDGVSSTSGLVAALSIDDPSGDELDDIDNIRDDLQSTKQMLALELRNRETQERENKKLLAKIATLEAELAREKSREKNLEYGSNVIVATMDATPASEEAYVNSLKKEADDARKTSKDLEKKYLQTGELLDQAKSEIDEQKRQIQMLERKLAQALQTDTPTATESEPFDFCYSFASTLDMPRQQGGGSLNGSRRPSDAHTGRDSSPDFDLQLSESDPDEPEEKKHERHERRLIKELKVLRSKLTKLKVKQEAAKKEKVALKQAMKKNHVILKEENKKFKKLEKEVHKMAASMKEEENDNDDDEENDDEEEDDEDAANKAEQEESEQESAEDSEESESEESEAETASESEAEDAANSDKKHNLEPRVKKHESRLSAMKKCNVLLQANVDNLQDEITQVRAKAASLQAELDAVLADLGF